MYPSNKLIANEQAICDAYLECKSVRKTCKCYSIYAKTLSGYWADRSYRFISWQLQWATIFSGDYWYKKIPTRWL